MSVEPSETSSPPTPPKPPQVYAAHIAGDLLELRAIDPGQDDHTVKLADFAAPPGYRVVAALEHSGGWTLALHSEPSDHALLHLDRAGVQSAEATFTKADGLAWLGEVLSIVVPRSRLPTRFVVADFEARYAMFQALQTDMAAVQLLAGLIATIPVDPASKIDEAYGVFIPDAEAATPVLVNSRGYSAATVDDFLVDNTGMHGTTRQVLSFIDGVCLTRDIVGRKAAIRLNMGPGMRTRAVYIPQHRSLTGLIADWPRPEALVQLMARHLLGLLCLSNDVARHFQGGIQQIGLHVMDRRDDLHIRGELGGLDQAAGAGFASLVKAVYVAGPQTERFGAIDDLVPAFSGKVVRQAQPRDWLRAAFEKQESVFRIESDVISAALASRLARSARDAARGFENELERRRRDLERTAKRSPLKLLVGLRADEESWPRQADGYAALAHELAQAGCPAIFVFDGCTIEPSASTAADAAALEACRRIVESFTAATADVADKIICVDNLGKPAAQSIVASLWSHGFIAPPGPHLARYRWVVNSPGLVLASPEERGDPDLLVHDRTDIRERLSPPDYMSPLAAPETLDPDVFAANCMTWLRARWPQVFQKRSGLSALFKGRG